MHFSVKRYNHYRIQNDVLKKNIVIIHITNSKPNSNPCFPLLSSYVSYNHSNLFPSSYTKSSFDIDYPDVRVGHACNPIYTSAMLGHCQNSRDTARAFTFHPT